MIIIQIPLKKEFIIDLLDQRKVNDQTFIYKKQDKFNLYFEVNGDQHKAAEIAKQVIKKSKYGSTLYFNVTIST